MVSWTFAMPDPRWDESQVERLLEWYEKDPGDAFVGEERLRDLPLDGLRQLFGVMPDDPEDPAVFKAYAVEPQHVKRVQRAVSHQLNLGRFDYFIAARQRRS